MSRPTGRNKLLFYSLLLCGEPHMDLFMAINVGIKTDFHITKIQQSGITLSPPVFINPLKVCSRTFKSPFHWKWLRVLCSLLNTFSHFELYKHGAWCMQTFFAKTIHCISHISSLLSCRSGNVLFIFCRYKIKGTQIQKDIIVFFKNRWYFFSFLIMQHSHEFKNHKNTLKFEFVMWWNVINTHTKIGVNNFSNHCAVCDQGTFCMQKLNKTSITWQRLLSEYMPSRVWVSLSMLVFSSGENK